MASSVKAASNTHADHARVNDTTYGAGPSVNWDANLTGLGAVDANREATAADLSSTGSPQSHRLDVKNFGFAIPAGATIDGIVARITWRASDTRQVNWLQTRLIKAGSPVGDNKATGSLSVITDTQQSRGGSTDLWGTTWTDSDINSSGFGVALQFNRTSSTGVRPQVNYVEIEVYYTESSGSITAIASITEAADTVSSTATVKVAATLAATEAADTLAATGTARIAGTLSATEAADALSSTLIARISAVAALTEAPDGLAATGTVRIASVLSASEASDALSATGVVQVVGTLAVTEGDDTIVGTIGAASSPITGSASITEGGDTLSGSIGPVAVETTGQRLTSLSGLTGVSAGAHLVALGSTGSTAGELLEDASPLGTATAIAHLAAITLTSGGTGTASITEAADVVAASTTVLVSGSAAITEAPDTLDSGAQPARELSLAVTEASDSVAATGRARIAGEASPTESDDLLVSTVALGLQPLNGAAAILEANDSLAAQSTSRVVGQSAIFEADDFLLAPTRVVLRATASIVELNDTLAVAGGPVVSATATFPADQPDTVVAITRAIVGATVARAENDDVVNSFADGTLMIVGNTLVVLDGMGIAAQGELGRRVRNRLAPKPRPVYLRKFRR